MNASHPSFPAPAATAVSALTPCLIVNPGSFRASSGGLAARALALGKAYGATVIEAQRPEQIRAGLDHALAIGPRPIVVLSGDGTVQALIDDLMQRYAGAELPPLLLLGGGRSNVTAADVGGRGQILHKLETALARWRSGVAFTVEERPVLVVEQAPAPPRHGFFVAGELVDAGIRDCRRYRESGSGPLRQGHLSTGWYVLRLIVLALLGRSPLQTNEVSVDAPGLGSLQGKTRLLLASTLRRHGGLLNPYAARGQGPLRFTAISTTAPRFWSTLPALLRGRFSARQDAAIGYLSGRCARVEVLGLRGCSLDGEAVDTDPTRPVVIRAGATLRFLQP